MFKTIKTIPAGPHVVTVIKSKHQFYSYSARVGHFIAVDGKIKELDMLNIGRPGWEGLSQREAIIKAVALSNNVEVVCRAYNHAKDNYAQAANKLHAINASITMQRQRASLDNLIAKYRFELQAIKNS
jgi:ABC-type lipopolysaccharide export system ATPase subunit